MGLILALLDERETGQGGRSSLQGPKIIDLANRFRGTSESLGGASPPLVPPSLRPWSHILFI
jgi:hypothetical protein